MSSFSLDLPSSKDIPNVVVSLCESGLNFSAFNMLRDVWSRKDGLHHICHFLQSTDLNVVFPSSHSIDLSRNQLTNHDVRRIIDALQYNIHCTSYDAIYTLDLSHNMLRHDAEITRDIVTLIFTKLPNLRTLNVTESGLFLHGDIGDDVYFDIVDSTKTRRVEWPQRKTVDIGPDDQFDFEFIDETDTESDWVHDEDHDVDAQRHSDDEGDDDEFENLFIVDQEAEDGDYEEEEAESRGFAPNELDFYALSLCEDPSNLSSCEEQEEETQEEQQDNGHFSGDL